MGKREEYSAWVDRLTKVREMAAATEKHLLVLRGGKDPFLEAVKLAGLEGPEAQYPLMDGNNVIHVAPDLLEHFRQFSENKEPMPYLMMIQLFEKWTLMLIALVAANREHLVGKKNVPLWNHLMQICNVCAKSVNVEVQIKKMIAELDEKSPTGA